MLMLRYRTVGAFVAGLAIALIGVFVFHAWRVDAVTGDDDTTFVPITACRLADTRTGPNRVGLAGGFSANDTKTFVARGNNGKCVGIPADAVGLSLNVTALNATSLTFLTFWPDGSRPDASSLNPAPGQPPVPNAVTTKLSGSGSFNVYNESGSVNVIIDINGYYTKTSLQQTKSGLQQLQTQIDALKAADSALEAAQPFAVSNRDDTEFVGFDDHVVVSVTVTAPVAGQVAVTSSATAYEDVNYQFVVCSITTGTTRDLDYIQQWMSPASGGSTSTPIAGTRVFDIAAGATVTYNLVCVHVGGDPGADSIVNDSVLTAIFTPAP